MVFQQIDFHNVEEIEQRENGYIMWRIPGYLRKRLGERAGECVSRFCCGVELRFKILGNEATVILRAEEMDEARVHTMQKGSGRSDRRRDLALTRRWCVLCFLMA